MRLRFAPLAAGHAHRDSMRDRRPLRARRRPRRAWPAPLRIGSEYGLMSRFADAIKSASSCALSSLPRLHAVHVADDPVGKQAAIRTRVWPPKMHRRRRHCDRGAWA